MKIWGDAILRLERKIPGLTKEMTTAGVAAARECGFRIEDPTFEWWSDAVNKIYLAMKAKIEEKTE